MLVARRDPPFESAGHESPFRSSPHAPPRTPRVLHGLQVIGSLLAIPVGLASAYSIYQTNFTIDARCETLRTNIVSMLDKNADPAALRMLVRRDVVSFQNTCGSVDPDAVTAFQRLLAVGQAAKPQAKPVTQVERQSQPTSETARQQVATPPLPAKKPVAAADAKPTQQDADKTQRHETEVKTVHRDVEAKPIAREVEAKPARAPETKPALREAVREQPRSDTEWLDAVRGALVHAPAVPAPEKNAGPAVQIDNVARQAAPPPRALGELRSPAAAASEPAVVSAPELAPATPVAAAPAPAADTAHPVPPGSIPDDAPQETAALPAEKPTHSRIKALIADIPLLGRIVDR